MADVALRVHARTFRRAQYSSVNDTLKPLCGCAVPILVLSAQINHMNVWSGTICSFTYLLIKERIVSCQLSSIIWVRTCSCVSLHCRYKYGNIVLLYILWFRQMCWWPQCPSHNGMKSGNSHHVAAHNAKLCSSGIPRNNKPKWILSANNETFPCNVWCVVTYQCDIFHHHVIRYVFNDGQVRIVCPSISIFNIANHSPLITRTHLCVSKMHTTCT
jgi:hypothetical protein